MNPYDLILVYTKRYLNAIYLLTLGHILGTLYKRGSNSMTDKKDLNKTQYDLIREANRILAEWTKSKEGREALRKEKAKHHEQRLAKAKELNKKRFGAEDPKKMMKEIIRKERLAMKRVKKKVDKLEDK